MNCYQGFARMYDALMTDAPYDEWAAYIDHILRERLAPPATLPSYADKPCNVSKPDVASLPLVLDLACGTGAVTILLAGMGYDMLGADASEDMLAEAQRKAYEQGADILFLAQDMRELDLFGTVDAVVSVCDGLNYILSEEELLAVFKRVRLFLNPGGVFIFDMNTEYKFKERFAQNTFEDKGAGGEAYVWENRYDPATRINEYHMHFYNIGSEKGGKPFYELHRQRAYPPVDVANLLLEAGFCAVSMRDGYSQEPPKADSTRVVFVVE